MTNTEYDEDKYREENETCFLLHFKGSIYIDALDNDEAIARAKDRDDLVEFIDKWETD